MGLSKWLPVQKFKRTINAVIIAIPKYFMFSGTKLAIKPGIPPVELPANCRLIKADIKKSMPIEKRLSPIAEALKYADVLNETSVNTMLPERDSKRTNSKVVSELLPYFYKWHNKTKTLFRGPKPDYIQN